MTTRESPPCEGTCVPSPQITGVGGASKIQRIGRVPREIFSDPRLADATPLDLLFLLTAYVHARRDDSQRIVGRATPTVGWLMPVGEMVAPFAKNMHCSEDAVQEAVVYLKDRGFLVRSDALVWGVTGWERPDTRRVRAFRARAAAVAAPVEAEPDFYPFERSPDLQQPRATSAARAKVGPLSTGHDDAAIAERDNRRPMGRR